MLKSFLKLAIYTALAGTLITSCAKVNVPAIKQAKKIALISVLSPESVDTNAVSGGSLLALAASAVQSDSTKMESSMNMVKSEILQETPQIFKVKIASESSVINNKNYKAVDDKNWGGKVAPKGYKQIYPDQTEKIVQAISGLKDVGGALIVDMKSKLVPNGTSLTGAVLSSLETTMVFHMYDKKGEKILMQGATRTSGTSISSRVGIFDGDDIKKELQKSVKNVLAYVKEMIADEYAEFEKSGK